jgi:hypothetical protein
MKNLQTMGAAAVLALLAACGGGSNDPVAAVVDNTTVPASAAASPAAYITYTGSMAVDDRAEPLSVDAIEPPTSDTTEPADVS